MALKEFKNAAVALWRSYQSIGFHYPEAWGPYSGQRVPLNYDIVLNDLQQIKDSIENRGPLVRTNPGHSSPDFHNPPSRYIMASGETSDGYQWGVGCGFRAYLVLPENRGILIYNLRGAGGGDFQDTPRTGVYGVFSELKDQDLAYLRHIAEEMMSND